MKYERTENDFGPRHDWSLKGGRGGVHIWARTSKLPGWPTEWFGGCECHTPHTPEHDPQAAPSHEECWLLKGPCWHDGSSLMFNEQIAPFLPLPDSDDPHALEPHHHSMVEWRLRYLMDVWFPAHPAA